MTGVFETMKKIINSPITKAISLLIVVIAVAALSSFTTGKTMRDGLSQYAQYQFKESIKTVIEENVSPSLQEIKGIAIEARDGVISLQQDKFETWVKDINKYYEKFKKGDTNDFTDTNFKAMVKWWKSLPDDYKDDALKVKYQTLIDYYSKVY